MPDELTGVVAIGLVLAAVVVVALLGLAIVRRTCPHDRLARHTEVAGYVYAVIGVVYAVILGQVVVAAWDQYQDAEFVADAEANAVLNLARLALVWPDEERMRVEGMLGAYARHVVEVEWPAMERGEFDPSLHTEDLHDLWQLVGEAGERAGNRSPSYAAALQQLDALDEARRSRVLLGEGELPIAMRLTLLIGAVITIGFSYLFAVESRWVHGLMTASLAMLVALLLLLEFQLEKPFQGISAIPSTAMELVLTDIESGLRERETSS